MKKGATGEQMQHSALLQQEVGLGHQPLCKTQGQEMARAEGVRSRSGAYQGNKLKIHRMVLLVALLAGLWVNSAASSALEPRVNAFGHNLSATRGCFVLCVTPRAADGRVKRSGVLHRTRAGSFQRVAGISVLPNARGSSSAECSLGGSTLKGCRSYLRGLYDRFRGRAPVIPAATVGQDVDGKLMEGRGEPLLDLRAGGNTSTFDADAGCPTCRTPIPDTTASIFSRLLFSWVNPLMVKGNQKYVQEEDLWDLREDQQTGYVADSFESAFQREVAAAGAG
ncbi:unnamed protein product, partial [Discosporangium mesarthrocarpum]